MGTSKDIEVILTRQWADCLAIPIFIVDPSGNLIFYNEPAEHVLGKRFDESGELPASVWTSAFSPQDENGNRLPANTLPLMIALEEHRSSHATFWIRGLDNVSRRIAVTAFPLIGSAGRNLGAVAIFWEAGDS